MPLYGADSFLGWMDNWRSQGLNPKGPILNTKIRKADPSVMDSSEIRGEESEEQKYKRIEQEQAFKGAGLPTIGVGDFQLGISDFVTPGGLAKLVAAPAAMLTGAMAIGSKVAGPVSQLAKTVGKDQAGAILSEKRLHELVDLFSYAHKAKTKAALTRMTPEEFLALTTTDVTYSPTRKDILNASAPINPSLEARWPEYPNLLIEDGKIRGHEGRHRMGGLIKSGYGSDPVPVVLRNYIGTQDLSTIKEMIPANKLHGQFQEGNVVNIVEPIPLHRDLTEELMRWVDDRALRELEKGIK